MRQEQRRLQSVERREYRGIGVAPAIVLGSSKVSLGVAGIVKPPVGDRRHGRTRGNDVGALGEHHQRHVSAVAPAEHPDAPGIDAGLSLQPARPGQLIAHLDLAEPSADRIRESAAAARGTTIVEREHHVALLRHVFVDHARPVAPDVLLPRAAVDVQEDRVVPRRIESRRFHQSVLQVLPVLRPDAAEFGHDVTVAVGPVGVGRIQSVGLDPRHPMPVGRIDADLRWSAGIRKGVDIQGDAPRIPGELRGVPAVAATDAVRLGGILPVEPHRVDLPIDDRVPVGGEIDESRGLIHRQQFIDVPTAQRQRAAQPAIQIVEIQVVRAGSLRRPDERWLLFQKTQVIRQIDPHRRRLRDQRSLPQCGGVDQDEVEPLLIACEALEGEPAAIRCPIGAREINVRIGAQVDPTRLAAGRRDQAELDGDIGIPGERVALLHHLGPVCVDLSAAGDRHGTVVEPLVHDGRVVGGPPVSAGLHQFFLSDEFRLGIVDAAAAVGGQTTLVTPLEVDHP